MTYPCDPMRPFLGCASCAYSGGETPAAATESAPVSGVASGKIALAMTNGPGLHTGTVLATPIQASEQEGWQT